MSWTLTSGQRGHPRRVVARRGCALRDLGIAEVPWNRRGWERAGLRTDRRSGERRRWGPRTLGHPSSSARPNGDGQEAYCNAPP